MTSRHVGLACAAAVSMLVVGTASAGGSPLKFGERSYRPGDVARGVAAVSYAHNSALGTPEQGPYYVYLAAGTAQNQSGAWPSVPDGAVRVGVLEFRRGPVQEPGTTHLTGPDHVRTEFTVPDLPPGSYSAVVCNDPCRSSIGDVTDGVLVISHEAPSHAATAAASTAAAAGSQEPLPVTLAGGDDGDSARRLTVAVTSAGIGLLGLAALGALRLRRSVGDRGGAPATARGPSPRAGRADAG